MEEMITRWIRETKFEFEKAKLNQNLDKMNQMKYLRLSLEEIRENPLKP